MNNLFKQIAINACGAAIGLAALTGCAGIAGQKPLRVGITPDYPPLVFERGAGFAGAEVELADALGKELGRPVEFVSLRWEEQIPALLAGRTDIIMSGMSITPSRQIRVAFSEPYLHNQLRVVFAREKASRYKTKEDILNTGARIGVIAGTTGDAFVQKNCPRAERVPIRSRGDVAFYLLQGDRIDLFVDDTFALAQIFSENEARLAYLEQPLEQDDLAWAVQPGDPDFLRQVNAALARWKSDGTLEKVLTRWMPYLSKYEARLRGEPAEKMP